MQIVTESRRVRLKPSFATRRVDPAGVSGIDTQAHDLRPGDVVLARIEEIGHHQRLERPDGRRALLYPGDEVLLACGARYAPDQFEADCPEAVGPAQLVAAGGIAGHVSACHTRMKPPTALTIIGAALDGAGRRIRLADHALANAPIGRSPVPVILVCGTSMNSGKTHALASLVRGLRLSGVETAAIKATGTGAGGDLWFFRDSGAAHVADFTDAGFATTYRADPAAVFDGLGRLAGDAVARGAGAIVMELADGLGQQETAALMRMPALKRLASKVVFAAADAFGAKTGVDWLTREGHSVCAVSGLLAASPLALRETRAALDAPCLTAEELMTPERLREVFPHGMPWGPTVAEWSAA